MRINVRLFAILRERAGVSQVALDLPDCATVRDAKQQLAAKFPSLGAMIDRAALAVNQTYARPDMNLNDGDELALIPPVSGG